MPVSSIQRRPCLEIHHHWPVVAGSLGAHEGGNGPGRLAASQDVVDPCPWPIGWTAVLFGPSRSDEGVLEMLSEYRQDISVSPLVQIPSNEHGKTGEGRPQDIADGTGLLQSLPGVESQVRAAEHQPVRLPPRENSDAGLSMPVPGVRQGAGESKHPWGAQWGLAEDCLPVRAAIQGKRLGKA